jgi:hypothetical protein
MSKNIVKGINDGDNKLGGWYSNVCEVKYLFCKKLNTVPSILNPAGLIIIAAHDARKINKDFLT